MTRGTDNLAELWHRFDANTAAAQALAEIRSQASGKGEWELDELLRHHRDEPIEDDDEISMRDAFDDLLSFYSCVEIAALIGFLSEPLPESFRDEIAITLCNRHIRAYYRTRYPLLLPDMLLARVGQLSARRERGEYETLPLFFEFLQVSSTLEADPSIEMLLWFLDDGYHLGYGWADALAILGKPKRLIGALQKGPHRRNPAESAVDGLRKFLGFCVALDDLLCRSAPFPVFRAAMWHYHAYWFRTIRGEIREALEHALGQFQRWLSSPMGKQLSEAQRKALTAEATNSSREVRKAVRRLTGRTYGHALTKDQGRIRRDSARAAQMLDSQMQSA